MKELTYKQRVSKEMSRRVKKRWSKMTKKQRQEYMKRVVWSKKKPLQGKEKTNSVDK